MLTQPFPWMWSMSGLGTGQHTRLLPHNPLHLFFSISTEVSNSNYQSFFFIPRSKQLLLLHPCLFHLILFTAGPKKSLVSITWFLEAIPPSVCLQEQLLLLSRSLSAGWYRARLFRDRVWLRLVHSCCATYDIDKLLTESRLNHNRRCESPVTSWKLPIGSWPWARIQFSYHQLTFMTPGLWWCTWKIQVKQVNDNEEREKRCQHMAKGSVLRSTS